MLDPQLVSPLLVETWVADFAGNIVGPLLFKSEDAPRYRSGVVAVLGIFVAAAGVTAVLVAWFMLLNKRKEKVRVANGKPAKLVDRSMDAKYSAQVELKEGEEGYGGVRLGDQAFLDMTDHKNDEVRLTIWSRSDSADYSVYLYLLIRLLPRNCMLFV